MLLPILLSSLFLAVIVSSRHVHITLRENVTQPCPGVQSDVVDRESLRFSFDPIGRPAGASDAEEDTATLTTLQGESRQISFPGCYRIRLSFRVNKPLKNPYVESFLQLGTNLPCQSASAASAAANICTNITQTSWCPKSAHERLRRMTNGKNTCQFCNLCGALRDKDAVGEAAKYLRNEGSSQCDTEADRHSVHFTLCTPTRQELQEKNSENEGKLQQYWDYLKQGVLTAVVHVLDRAELPASKLSQCRTLCGTFQKKKGVSSSYKTTLLKSIESLCTPQDEYAACVYHTLKFDLNGDFLA